MSFSKDLEAFCKTEAPAKTNAIVRKFVMEVANRVVLRSPVGDPSKWEDEFKVVAANLGWTGEGYVGGRFRANWQYSFGSPVKEAANEIDKSGGPTLDKIRSRLGTAPFASVHWLANNMPYAQRLEEGYSGQAPQGIVGLVEMEFPAIFEAAKR